ncbi:unnamed protein product [Haemonchus placei]|uniref:Uncharacterized protein n=1 Tax=Haemonchus placei TaxID=6290 RepID=A0A0N4X4L0_HAEPC|nr:unnamed protein product [Haemonchus placei]
MLRELYNNFTTRISPFYKADIINVKRGVQQVDTISHKLLITAPENIMRTSKPKIEQAEQMLADSDNACGRIGLRLNSKKMFMKKVYYLLLPSR